MTKVINIPGRLHSVEQGNIVAGANEVYDDTKGKKQNVINSETDAELLRLEQTKQDNLTFDNAPTENSSNPVKSGGVYAADLVLQQAIEAILLLIPSAATSLNQLADKAFVNSSISTATATFRGTYNVVTDLHLAVDATHAQIETALASVIATADNNDYCFVQIPVSSSSQDIQKTSRYKFNGTVWGFEYDLNTSGFTSAQWAAINSGITAALVTKLGDLPTATELSTDLQALSTAIGSEETRAKGVEQGLSTAVQGILDLIPSAAASSNKLTDKAYVDGLIQAITALIPAEATDENQLADKAYVLAQILAATPAFKGQFTTLVELQAVQNPKAGDLGIVRTTDTDGYAVFTFYQYLNNQWNVYFTLSHHNQKKPATTGTTGDYPYNGMAKVLLDKNMVGGVNTLVQSMMPVATGGNTIYVIQYDFVLGENITIPANCVLQFDGGSVSNVSGNSFSLTGTNTYYFTPDKNAVIFKDITFSGSWLLDTIYDTSFDYTSDNDLFASLSVLSNSNINTKIVINDDYSVAYDNGAPFEIQSNSDIEVNGTISLIPNSFSTYQIFNAVDKQNIKISGNGNLVGDCEDHDYTQEPGTHEQGHGIRILHCENVEICGIHISYCTGDGLYVGSKGSGMPSKNINVHDIETSYNRRQGLSVTGVKYITVDHVHSHHIGKAEVGGIAPMSGIDFEDSLIGENDGNKNVVVSNCILHDNAGSYDLQFGEINKNVTVSNVLAEAGLIVFDDKNENVNIQNSTFSEIYIRTSNANKKVTLTNCKAGGVLIGASSNAEMFDCVITDDIATTSAIEALIEFVGNNADGQAFCLSMKGCKLYSTTKQVLPKFAYAISTDSIFDLYDCTIKGDMSNSFNASFYKCFIEPTAGFMHICNMEKEIKFIDNTVFSYYNGACYRLSITNRVTQSLTKFLLIGNKFISYDQYTEVIGVVGVPNSVDVICNIFYNQRTKTDGDSLARTRLASVPNLKFISSDLRYSDYDTKPTLGARQKGNMIFDNDNNGKPIWWNGTAWVDATGTPV